MGRLRGYLKVRQAAAGESLRHRLRVAAWIAATWIALTLAAAAARLFSLL